MDRLMALRLLNEAGYEAYLVGGCVRDMLLENENMRKTGRLDSEHVRRAVDNASDIDITTNALPDDIKRVFAGMQIIETGIRHGTVTVMIPVDDRRRSGEGSGGKATSDMEACGSGNYAGEALMPVEITTYRIDAKYSDSRHPDRVEFTLSLREDLARRDFTVNAIAVDIDGNVEDPFCGVKDIRSRLIKAVGNPDERFQEDALRIMRALRFAAVLGFDIEQETEAALFRSGHMLREISEERILSEFKKLVTGANAGAVVRKYVDVLGAVIPELAAMKGFEQHNAYHKYDVLEHCVRAMEAIRTTDENRLHMKLAALFHDVGKPLTYSPDDNGRGHFYGHAAKGAELAAVIFSRLKADHALSERICLLIKYHDLIFEKDERLLKKWMNRFTPQVLFEILEIKLADNFATGNMSERLRVKFEEIREMMEDIVRQGQCFSLKSLAVNGSDIISIGISEGPEVGAVLNGLLDAVIDGRAPNEKGRLLELALEYKETGSLKPEK